MKKGKIGLKCLDRSSLGFQIIKFYKLKGHGKNSFFFGCSFELKKNRNFYLRKNFCTFRTIFFTKKNLIHSSKNNENIQNDPLQKHALTKEDIRIFPVMNNKTKLKENNNFEVRKI